MKHLTARMQDGQTSYRFLIKRDSVKASRVIRDNLEQCDEDFLKYRPAIRSKEEIIITYAAHTYNWVVMYDTRYTERLNDNDCKGHNSAVSRWSMYN